MSAAKTGIEMGDWLKIAGIVLIGSGLLTGQVAQASSDSVTYTYDALGRIATATYANGTIVAYSYDLAGNRLGQQVTCGSSGC